MVFGKLPKTPATVADCYTDQEPAEYGIHMIPMWYPAERGKTGIRRPVLTVVAIETCQSLLL